MGKTVEIRWHGRGGQGAKTASLLLAEAAFSTGSISRAFLNTDLKEWAHLLRLTTEYPTTK